MSDISLSGLEYHPVGAPLTFGNDDNLTIGSANVRLVGEANGAGVDMVAANHLNSLNDFNGDGLSDILWRNTATGTFTLWQSNGHGFDENVAVQSGVGTDWHVQSPDYIFG